MNILDRASLDRSPVMLHWWYLSLKNPWPFIPVLFFLSFHQLSFLMNEFIPIPWLLRFFESLEAQLRRMNKSYLITFSVTPWRNSNTCSRQKFLLLKAILTFPHFIIIYSYACQFYFLFWFLQICPMWLSDSLVYCSVDLTLKFLKNASIGIIFANFYSSCQWKNLYFI